MTARTRAERQDRLELMAGMIAAEGVSLQNLIAELATETRRGFDRVAAQFEETDRHMRETDERMRRSSHELDERVDKLVLAIAELIRNQNASRA